MTIADYARAHGRLYVTPEDCEAAVNGGLDPLTLYRELITLIAAHKVEDVTACCLVALHGEYMRRSNG